MTIAVDLGHKVTSKHIVIVFMTFFFHGYNFLLGCEYGDKQTWCSTLTRSQCYLNADMCCGFCNRPDIKDTNIPGILNLFHNKCRLLFSSAEKFKKPLWQTVWTQIRLLLYIGAVCSGSTLLLLYLIRQ